MSHSRNATCSKHFTGPVLAGKGLDELAQQKARCFGLVVLSLMFVVGILMRERSTRTLRAGG